MIDLLYLYWYGLKGYSISKGVVEMAPKKNARSSLEGADKRENIKLGVANKGAHY